MIVIPMIMTRLRRAIVVVVVLVRASHDLREGLLPFFHVNVIRFLFTEGRVLLAAVGNTCGRVVFGLVSGACGKTLGAVSILDVVVVVLRMAFARDSCSASLVLSILFS